MKRYLNLNGISWVLDGDTDRAMGVRPLAQKMMHVMKMQNVNNLDHIWYTHRMEDGTVIRVESLFGRDKAYVYCEPKIYAPKKEFIKKTVRVFVPGICLNSNIIISEYTTYYDTDGIFGNWGGITEGSFGDIHVCATPDWGGHLATVKDTPFPKQHCSKTEAPPFKCNGLEGLKIYPCTDWGNKNVYKQDTVVGSVSHSDTGNPGGTMEVDGCSVAGCSIELGSCTQTPEAIALAGGYTLDSCCANPGYEWCEEYTGYTCGGEYGCLERHREYYLVYVGCGWLRRVRIVKVHYTEHNSLICSIYQWIGTTDSVEYETSLVGEYQLGSEISRDIVSSADGIYELTLRTYSYPYGPLDRTSGNIIINDPLINRTQRYNFHTEYNSSCVGITDEYYTLQDKEPESAGVYYCSYIDSSCELKNFEDKYIYLFTVCEYNRYSHNHSDSVQYWNDGCTCTLTGVCGVGGEQSRVYGPLYIYAMVNGDMVELDRIAECGDYSFNCLESHIFDADGIPVYMYSYSLLGYTDDSWDHYKTEYVRYGYFYGSSEKHFQSEKYHPAGVLETDGKGISVLHKVDDSDKYAWGGCAGFIVEREIEVSL